MRTSTVPWEAAPSAGFDASDDAAELLREHLRDGTWQPPVMPGSVR